MTKILVSMPLFRPVAAKRPEPGLTHHKLYETRRATIREIREYIEIFYNRQRKQARLDYLSPAVFAKQFYDYEKKIAA